MTDLVGRHWAEAAEQEAAQLREKVRQNDYLFEQAESRRRELSEKISHAFAELTAVMLPALDTSSLERAAQLSGYTPLVQDSPLVRMAEEEKRLRARVAQIESEYRFIHRGYLRDPRGGKLVLELAEIVQAQLPSKQILDACDHPRLALLLASGYGTEAYSTPFWRLSYYADWEAGDEVLERFPGVEDFATVREQYLRAHDTFFTLEESASQIRAELAAVEALEREHEEHTRALSSLPERHLAASRQALGRHVLECGQAVRARFAAEPSVAMLAARAYGLTAKLHYLERLAEAQLVPLRATLNEAISRAERDASKFRRPKRVYRPVDPAAFQHRFRSKTERYQKAHMRFVRASDTIYVFDRYDRWDHSDEFLWWDAMTEGELDGGEIPEVAEHHRRYPQSHFGRSRWRDSSQHVPPFPGQSGDRFGHFDPS